MNDANRSPSPAPEAAPEPPEVEVVIEIPRGSFLKRGSTGHVDFISPLPCPFNYGSVPKFLGLEGDLLDALVLGPRLPLGTRIRVKAWGAVTPTDRDTIRGRDHPLSSDPSLGTIAYGRLRPLDVGRISTRLNLFEPLKWSIIKKER